MPRKLVPPPHQERTSPLVWCAAVICAIISVAVIIVGVVVFVGYLLLHPKVPSISVVGGRLDLLHYDLAGVMETALTITLSAENDNAKAHATFYDTKFKLTFEGTNIAVLVAPTFEVNKNSSRAFNYVVESYPVPLGPAEMDVVDQSLRRDVIVFGLKGSTRARWRLGPLGSMKFRCPLDCNLKFRPSDKSYINSRCTSKGK